MISGCLPRDYFTAAVAGMDGVSLEIKPLWAGEDVFVMQTRTYLKLARGLNDEQAAEALPRGRGISCAVSTPHCR
jgi:hypothetical protein